MSGKMKILLAVLALGALVSVSYAFSSLNGSATNPPATANSYDALATDQCHTDTDSDGLPDCEESFWNTDFKNPDTDGDGYKDGEEVLSNHNPLKKGPNDSLDQRGNVTDQAAELLFGAIAVGDLKPDSPKYYAAVEKYSDAVMERYQANSQVTVDEPRLSSDRRSDVVAYGFAASNTLAPVFQNLNSGLVTVLATIADTNLDELGTLNATNPEKYKAFLTEISRQIATFDGPIARLQALAVPPSMVTGHKNMLTFLLGMRQQYRLLHQTTQDPIQGLFALQSLATLARSTSVDVVQDFAGRLDNVLKQK